MPGVSDFAGTSGVTGYAGDGGPALGAKFNLALALAFDAAGNMYIADASNYVVRKIDANGIITTVAGNNAATPLCTDNAAATSCSIGSPYGVAIDSNGNLFISDKTNNMIRKVDANGIITRYAGTGVSGTSGDGGDALLAQLKAPSDIHLDAAGNLYIADQSANKIMQVQAALTTSGGNTYHKIVRYAAKGTAGYLDATSNQASTAMINNPYALTVDALGNLYISDTKNFVIRKVLADGTPNGGPSGAITTIAGVYNNAGSTPSVPGTDFNVPPLSAHFVYPRGLLVDPAGNLYIADSNDWAVKKIDKDFKMVTLFAGTQTGAYGSTGAALAQPLKSPYGLTMDRAGNIYVADNAVVRRIAFNNQFAAQSVGGSSASQGLYAQIDPTLSAGLTINSFGVAPGSADFLAGTVTGCTLGSNNPAASICTVPITFTPTAPGLRTAPVILTDNNNNSYIAGIYGVGNAPAVAFMPGILSTIAGTGTAGWSGDNSAATGAQLSAPSAIAVDAAGTVYIADAANSVIRKISGGLITTIAGNGTAGFLGDNGLAANAQLSNPMSVAVDAAGDTYIADTGNHRIRMISAQTGFITTIAGNGTAGFSGDGGDATTAQLSEPSGVAVDLFGNIFIADTGNNRIREIVGASITTVAGNGTAGYTGDQGAATAAELNGPTALVLDAAGNLFITDTQNGAIREVLKTAGTINTIGTGTSPSGVAVDAAENVYFADSGSSVVKVILAANGAVSTIAGNGSAAFSGDGVGSLNGALNHATGVTVDGAGRLYIADTANNRIRLVDVTAPVLNFGEQTVQTTSAAQTLTVTNIGNQRLNFSALSVPANFNEGTSANECSGTSALDPGASCSISLTFTPSNLGDFSGSSVLLTDNALNVAGAQQSIILNGAGVMIPTGLTVSSLPTTSIAGAVQSFTVASQLSGQTVKSYAGTVHFTSTDNNALLPADYTFTSADQGTHTFNITFKTAGQQTVAVVDTLTPSITGSESSTVTAGAAATITASAGASQTAQVNTAFPAQLKATVADQFGNPVQGVTVTFTAPSTGASGSFPGGSVAATAATDATGVATAPVLTANVTGGTFTVTASATGVVATTSFSLTVSSQIVPTVVLALTPASSSVPYGTSLLLGATVSPAAPGSITFYDNCVPIGTPAPLTNGTASITLGSPTTGTHSYTADYNSGDGTYSNSSTLAALPISVTTASVTVAGPAQPIIVTAGQSQSVTVTVAGQFSGPAIAAPTGSIGYQIDNGTAQSAPISSGQATLNIPSTLSGGSHSISVSYPGDTNYQAANISMTVSVAQQSQTITFAAIPNHTYGDAPFILSASASSGLNVTYKVVSGPASLSGTTLTILGGGTIAVEADQAGNQVYVAAAPAQQSFFVNPASTALTLTSSNPNINPGDSVTFTATLTSSVSGTPSGGVSFLDNGTALGTAPMMASNSSYTATYTTTKLTNGGQHSITAAYAGDQSFATSTSAAFSQNVISPDFSFTASSQSLKVVNGASGILTLTFTPSGKYSKQITLSCSNLPAKTTCVFTPNPVSLATTGTTSVTGVIQTMPTNGLLSEMRRPVPPRTPWTTMPVAVFLLPGGLMGCLAGFGRKRMTRKTHCVLLLLVLLLLLIGLTACGGTSAQSASSSRVGTPAGTTTFTINATDGTNTHSTNVSITVQ